MKYWKIVRLLLPLFFTMGCDDKNDSVREEQQTLIIASVLPAQKESLVLVGGSSGEGVWIRRNLRGGLRVPHPDTDSVLAGRSRNSGPQSP